MSPAGPLSPLTSALDAVQSLLVRFHNRGFVMGGVAASLLGAARYTADVDVLLILSTTRLAELLAAAQDTGFAPRIQGAEDFARQHRVLLLRHVESGTDVDLILGMLPFEEEAVERGVVHTIGFTQVRLPTPEDLIIMKAVAGRDKDLADISAVAERFPHLDRQRIERWVREFADALESPELWSRVSALLPAS